MNDPLLDKFVYHLQLQGRSDRTLSAYEADVRHFVTWFKQANERPFVLKELTAIDVREYRGHLLHRQCVPATVDRALAALRTLGTWAVQNGELSDNPAISIKSVETPALAPKWLNKKLQTALLRQLERAVNAARIRTAKWQAMRDQAPVILLLHTGLRVNELGSLQLSDLVITERQGKVTVRQGKGFKQRVVPLNVEARRAINAWVSVRPAWTHLYLFGGQRAETLQPRGVQRILVEYGQRAGVEVTPHTLRHSFAKNLINAGVSM